MEQKQACFHVQLVGNAQNLFKFALGISATRPELGYLAAFANYRHAATQEELALTREQEFNAASLLEHVATYILAVQLHAALLALFPQKADVSEQTMQSAIAITRLIRNAFTHNPFAPEWKIPSEERNQTFSVPEIISLETTELNGVYVKQADYGGSLALLALSNFVVRKLGEIGQTPPLARPSSQTKTTDNRAVEGIKPCKPERV